MEERKQGQIGCRMPGRTIGGTRPSNATVKKKRAGASTTALRPRSVGL